ncbi:VUT family protein [Coxiella burnetii]|uniref:Orf 206 protein n=1 Tax=Coxiella burnetii TaxID=777 RepID=Q45860_COXBE|nr:VUT family protein [Coxiella burnetii]AAD33481.1 hypothetical protein [Coxiella burnetii]ASY91614.1 hypothetical protein [Coxiella burnetii]ATN86910.1 hypothetical protein AYO29_10530 [Coxiella burnetii str. Schperling]UYK70736.1 VUT family protein [Coxiella burnetii]CAA59948.1 orf 206 [Coxiella burnetii]
MSIFGFHIAMSGLLFPFSFILLIVITETYGYRETGRAILIILLSQNILLILLSITARLPSPTNIPLSHEYYSLFSGVWRILISGNIAIPIAFFFNSLLNSKLKVYLKGTKWVVRFLLTNALSKGLLVFISYPINFFGVLPIKTVLHICLDTWLFKIVFCILTVWLIRLISEISSKVDSTDIYDINTNYSLLQLYSPKNSGMNLYGR